MMSMSRRAMFIMALMLAAATAATAATAFAGQGDKPTVSGQVADAVTAAANAARAAKLRTLIVLPNNQKR
jgi:hypothetical protein